MSAPALSLALSLSLAPPAGRVIEGPPTATHAEPSTETKLPTSSLAWQPAPVAPGGYWQFGEQNVPEPDDGDEALTIGSVIFSLGLIRAAAGGVSVYLATRPEVCKDGCRSMNLYGWGGVGFGGLMAVTGAVLLIVGAAQRAEHLRWQRGEARLRVGPWSADRRSLGLAVDLRF